MIIREEIQKASKNPLIKWRHIDIQYYNSLTPTDTPSEPGILYVLQGVNVGSFRFITGETSSKKTAVINIDAL